MTLNIPEISAGRCFDRLARGAVVVTSTRGLARRLAAGYADRRLEKGDRAWETPDVLPMGAWLSRLFDDAFYCEGSMHRVCSPGPQLMSDLQETLAWERIVSQSDVSSCLLGVHETAKTAREAWRLCREWKVDTGSGMEWSAPDPAAFAAWAGAFEQFCRDNGYVDRAGLAAFLSERVKDGLKICRSREVILAGFDEISPAVSDLLSVLCDCGITVSAMSLPARNADACLVSFEDDASEIRAAALWARQRLESDPSARIGVVSARLAEDREAVCRVFEDVFHPSFVFAESEPEDRMFQISAAPALARYPVVSAARAILGLTLAQGAEVFEWSRILRLPFTGGAKSEYCSRAALDAEIRSRGDIYFPVSGVLSIARGMTGSARNNLDLRILSKILERIGLRAGAMDKKMEPDKWMEEFSAILEDAGWPGESGLSGAEFQAVSALRENMEAFSGIGPITGRISGAEALRILSRRLSDTPFQPEQPSAEVSITGVLESAGEEFDSLWIMGMHHENWPPPARPNPFLPVQVQRSLGLPHCSPARELSYAGGITRRLLCSADEVICSFGETDGESTRLPSPLVDHLKKKDGREVFSGRTQTWWQKIQCCGEKEKIMDTAGRGAAEGADVAGGTGIMKSQALCPFQAYARYRLGASGLQAPEPGLNPLQRGLLVHHSLELFWGRLGGNHALCQMDRQQITGCIRESVAAAVDKMAEKMPGTFTKRFTAVETMRLENLLEEWIGAEQGRAPFSVDETEGRIHVEISGIGFLAFADRIDRLDDGRLVIIDYKTGEASPRDWFAERITEPQLPLYSIAKGRGSLAGVFFGRVKKGDSAYSGIAETEGIVPGCRGIIDDRRVAKDFENMQEVLDFWEEKLSALAGEIKTGHAAVLPVFPNKTCRFCDLSAVCRIWEASETIAGMQKADDDTGY
ncbi:MAG: PD-(D/E)XK nuclease family protein [Desulfobacterales bacterium]